jgi:CRISPR-associated endonuclease/helicase Cas3
VPPWGRYSTNRVSGNPGAIQESTTHPDALATLAAESPLWRKHATWISGIASSQVRLADLNIIDRQLRFSDTGNEFPSAELARRIQTRLGEGDRIVEIEPAVRSPFGTALRRLTIAAHLAPGAPDDAAPSGMHSTAGTTCFRFGGHSFRYDRHGLSRVPESTSSQQEYTHD